MKLPVATSLVTAEPLRSTVWESSNKKKGTILILAISCRNTAVQCALTCSPHGPQGPRDAPLKQIICSKHLPLAPDAPIHHLRCLTRDTHDCTLVLAEDELLLLDPGMTYSRPLYKLSPSRHPVEGPPRYPAAANERFVVLSESSWLDSARGLFFIVSNARGPVVLRVM